MAAASNPIFTPNPIFTLATLVAGFGPEGAKSSSQPSFIDTLDKVKIAEIACGYGHTLLLAESASEVEGMDEFDGERVVKAGKERAGKKTKAA